MVPEDGEFIGARSPVSKSYRISTAAFEALLEKQRIDLAAEIRPEGASWVQRLKSILQKILGRRGKR